MDGFDNMDKEVILVNLDPKEKAYARLLCVGREKSLKFF